MAYKPYRPKADAGENLSIDINLPNTETGGDTLSISASDWPYTPKNDAEDKALADYDLVTNQPAPKKEG